MNPGNCIRAALIIIALALLTGCATAGVDQRCNPEDRTQYWSNLPPVLACETAEVFSDTFIQIERGVAYSAGRGR
jgi:hypothetical protein